jgi:hypothetical protein
MLLKIRILKYFIFFSTILLIHNLAYGQGRLLDKKITLQVSGEEVKMLLNRIEKLYEVNFSYNSDIIPSDSVVTFTAENKSLEKVLELFLGKEYYFKSTARYIIILQKKNQTEINPNKSKYNITGIVLDSRTNNPLPSVTVYDMGSMVSTQSDSSGRFNLTLVPNTHYIAIHCSKLEYSDTVSIINPTLNEPLLLRLMPVEKPLQKLNSVDASEVTFTDSVGIRIIKTIVSKEMLVNSKNVIMYDKRIAQLSLLPKMGTNLRLSGAVVNHFSINLLGGYSNGVAGFEAGSIVNINKNNVVGFQVCCLFNVSGKNVNGFQAAGLSNLSTGNVKGCQISVVSNIGADTVKGVQIAGIINVCNKKLSGLQLSPGFNISRGAETGAQVAGLMNYAANPRFQFGLINIADTSDGIPMGVINIIKHGYYSFSVTVDELQTGYFLFSMGTRRLYSILGISGCTVNDHSSWGINYGLGSHFLYKHRLSFNVEFLSSIINAFGSFDSTTISRLSLSTQLSFRLGKHFYLSAGPSFNTFISDADNFRVNEFISNALPKRNWLYSSINTRYDAWIGGYAGLKYKF